jgi:hypothetical protein
MNNKIVEIVAIVEGLTEQIFIRDIVTPFLAKKNIFLTGSRKRQQVLQLQKKSVYRKYETNVLYSMIGL